MGGDEMSEKIGGWTKLQVSTYEAGATMYEARGLGRYTADEAGAEADAINAIVEFMVGNACFGQIIQEHSECFANKVRRLLVPLGITAESLKPPPTRAERIEAAARAVIDANSACADVSAYHQLRAALDLPH